MDYRKVLEKETFYCPDIMNLIDKYIYTTERKERYDKVLTELELKISRQEKGFMKMGYFIPWENKRRERNLKILRDYVENYVDGKRVSNYKVYLSIKGYEAHTIFELRNPHLEHVIENGKSRFKSFKDFINFIEDDNIYSLMDVIDYHTTRITMLLCGSAYNEIENHIIYF